MSPERDDPVLDAMLEEAVGGHKPPDLTSRIMQAWAIRREQETAAAEMPVAPPPMPSRHSEPTASASSQVRVESKSRKKGVAWQWMVPASVAMVLGVGLIGVLAYMLANL